MEREKDKIIQRLKDFIINHNEPMLIGSCGSSMFGQSEEKKVDQHARINDESTIEAQSMVSFDNNDHDDYIKLIMNDYNCGRCEEKDKILKANEERINEFKAYIKK
jgi:Zn ribbon nucleic-acid-binding protein